MRLTAEQKARVIAVYGVYANEACDKCGKVLTEIRWTRNAMPETYCSRTCRDGRGKQTGGAGLHGSPAFVKGKP